MEYMGSKMIKKRFVVLALACAMLLAATACIKSDDGNNKKDDITSAATADNTEADTAGTTAAVTDAPETGTDTTPEITTPEVTEPPATEPPVTEPPATEPPQIYPDGKYTREELEALDNTKYGWGQGVHVDSANRPTACTYWQEKYGAYGGIYIMPEADPARLTFDLGYEYGCTGRILDTLKEKGVKGTFFVTMYYVQSQPELVRRMVDEGHIVGNHSVNHKSMPTLSVDEMEREIMELHGYVKENFGYEMYLFRPPMGEHSVRSLAVAQNLGYRSVLWSYTYLDYDVNNQKPVDEAYALVTKNAHKGAVYLLHGVSETNTAILGDVIDYLRSSGIGISNEW